MPAHLLELAPELIHHIALSFEEISDLKSFRCVCKEVSDATKPLLFSSVRVDAIPTNENMTRKLSFLKCLASTSESVIGSYVHTLKIGTLVSESFTERARKIEEYFRPALESLVNVRCVEWRPSSNDLPRTHATIIDVLGRMCRGLTKILLAGKFEDETQINALASILVPNITRSLRHLEIHSLSRAKVALESLFRQASISTSPSVVKAPLAVLLLPGQTVKHSLPRILDLRSLTTLDIGDLSDDGWQSLQAARVRLRHLRVERVSRALLSYLESDAFSRTEGGGLEKLQFEPRPAGQAPSPDLLDEKLQVPTYFYESVLPKHENTLREVQLVVPDPESGWILGAANAGVFDGSSRLESLDVCFNFDEIVHPGKPSNALADLLQFAASHPNLTELTLTAAATILRTCNADAWLKGLEEVKYKTCEGILAVRLVSTNTKKLRVRSGRSTFKLNAGSARFIGLTTLGD